jgi:D-lyxose ketol-isomerase
LKDLPVLGTTITITHIGKTKSIMRNTGNETITWRAMFNGKFDKGRVNGKTVKINSVKDKQGRDISWVDIKLKPGQQIEVTVL